MVPHESCNASVQNKEEAKRWVKGLFQQLRQKSNVTPLKERQSNWEEENKNKWRGKGRSNETWDSMGHLLFPTYLLSIPPHLFSYRILTGLPLRNHLYHSQAVWHEWWMWSPLASEFTISPWGLVWGRHVTQGGQIPVLSGTFLFLLLLFPF